MWSHSCCLASFTVNSFSNWVVLQSPEHQSSWFNSCMFVWRRTCLLFSPITHCDMQNSCCWSCFSVDISTLWYKWLFFSVLLYSIGSYILHGATIMECLKNRLYLFLLSSVDWMLRHFWWENFPFTFIIGAFFKSFTLRPWKHPC